jgi:hypothetical protein
MGRRDGRVASAMQELTHKGWGHSINRDDPVNYCPMCEVESWHLDREKCDYCGDEATLHFLSRGYSEELARLEWWQHHKDLCQECYDRR